MSKKISFIDIVVNMTAAVLALTAAVLLCVYLVRETPKDDISAEAAETHVIGTETETEPVTETTAVSVTTAADTETTETETSAPHEVRYDKEFFDNAFFVGDSISVGLVGYEFIKPENVFAQQGITTSSVSTKKIDEQTVYEKISAFNPEYICIMLGTNGLSFIENDVMADELGEFVDSLILRYPFAKIVVVSIPPITQKREEENPQKLDAVIEYNALIKQLAEEKGVAYADSCSLLQDETGYLGDHYAEKDGLHMKIHSYPVILGAIEEAVSEYYGVDISVYTAVTDENISESGSGTDTEIRAEATAAAEETTVLTETETAEVTDIPEIIIFDTEQE